MWGGRRYQPHRLAFELVRGDLRRSEVLVSTCHSSERCVEPDHFEIRSPLTNFGWSGDDSRAQRALDTDRKRLRSYEQERADEALVSDSVRIAHAAYAELAAFDRAEEALERDYGQRPAKRLCILSE